MAMNNEIFKNYRLPYDPLSYEAVLLKHLEKNIQRNLFTGSEGGIFSHTAVVVGYGCRPNAYFVIHCLCE
jgi:hypothetical protein